MCDESCDYCTPVGLCTQCAADPLRKNNTNCDCIDGYYLDQSTDQCLKCHPSCQTCADFQNCLSCQGYPQQ